MHFGLRRRLLASTVLVGASMLGSAAQAQDATAAVDDEVIVVTGSLITNPNLERATPVNVTTSEEIELRQSNTAEQLLRELPGTVPSIGSAVNNGNAGASFVDLRGVGSNRNVVLLDGVRITPADLLGRFDLNNVPLALVERTEILTGGAATTYGADAIGGVINFITKRNFSGLEVQASNQLTERGDGNVFRIDATIGASFDDGRGNVVVNIGYQEADAVFQGDRDFSRFSFDSLSGGVSGSGLAPVPSRFANVNPLGLDNITQGCGAAGQPACAVTQGTRQLVAEGGAFRTTGATDPFNFNPFNIFQTPFRRFNVFAQGNYELTDNIEVYSRALVSQNTVRTILAPSGSFGIPVTISLNNPFLTPAVRNGLCQFDTNPGAGYTPLFSSAECAAAATAVGPDDPAYREADTALFRRATEVGPRIFTFRTDVYDVKLGFRGDLTDSIRWDVFGTYGESQNLRDTQNETLNSRIRQSLLAGPNGCFDPSNGCVPVNFIGPEGSITPDQARFLSETSLAFTRVSQAQARATISGDFGAALPWAEDAVAFAVGGEYRRYSARRQADTLGLSGDVGGTVDPNIRGGYDVYEAFGEVIAPLVQDKPFFHDLSIGGGIRYSSYTVDAPEAGNPSYNTTTWKVEGNWAPVEDIRFRGSFNRSVRAPNISELFTPVTTQLSNLTDDPCASINEAGAIFRPAPQGELRDICLAQGAPVGSLGAIPVPAAGQAQATTGGDITLQPERSDSYTVGVVLQPTFLPGFSASLDYWNIKIERAISALAPSDAIQACFGTNPLNPPAGASQTTACTVIGRNPVDGGLSGDSLTTSGLLLVETNQGRIETDGLDLAMNYNTDLGFARLALSFNGTWVFNNTFQAAPGLINRECVSFYSVNCASIQPEFFWNQRTTLSFDNVDVSLLWRHISATEQEPIVANFFAGNLPVGQSPLPGAPAPGSFGFRDFGKIEAFDYFDLSTRIGLTENVTLTFTVANLLDKQAPIVGNTAGTTSFNSGNTYPSTFDALGRTYRAAVRLRF